MDKQNIVYLYNGILLSNKKEWGTYACYYIDDPWKYAGACREDFEDTGRREPSANQGERP